MSIAIDAMQSAFMALANDTVLMPNRIQMEVSAHKGISLVMPCFVSGDEEAFAVKVANVFNENSKVGVANIQSALTVFEPATGRPIALLDGSAITAVRTAAASGLATRIMSRPNSEVLGIIGAGVQALTHVRAVCEVRTIRRVQIFGRTFEKAKSLAEQIRQNPALPDDVVACHSSQSAADGADILCTVTNAADVVVEDSAIKPGTHVVSIGSYKPTTRELSAETVLRSLVVVDQREGAWEEAGDLIQPLRAGLISEQHVLAELGELVTGAIELPAIAGNQITLFKSVGLAMQDAFAAAACLKNARDQELGQEVAW